MKPKKPKYKPRHTQAEKDYFKSIADMVRAKREQSTTPPALTGTQKGEANYV